MYIKIDESALSNGDIFSLARLSGIEDFKRIADIAFLSDLPDEAFYGCIDEIKSKLFYNEDEYIILRREVFEGLIKLIKEQNKKYWHEVRERIKAEECEK